MIRTITIEDVCAVVSVIVFVVLVLHWTGMLK